MGKLIVVGGTRLAGEVQTSGSKNAALALLSGALLAKGETVLSNVPKIDDVHTMVEVIGALGVKVAWEGDDLHIDATEITRNEPPYDQVRKMRASFCVMGPILARTGSARVPQPGGCDIGPRPINFHLKGLQALGAEVDGHHGYVEARANRLAAAEIYLDKPSAGATQHLMTAACLAEGTTVIRNAAREPEIVNLADMLRLMGARIIGDGTDIVHVEGVRELHGTKCRVISDRMEAGTYAIAAAITRGDVVIRDISPSHMEPFTSKLKQTGVKVRVNGDWVRISAEDRPNAVDIVTMPYPGFPTDLQQPFGALLTLARGTSVVTEKVYEARFRYIGELVRMGANIKQVGPAAVIEGVEKLTGTDVSATDLRAGAALVCAGLAAEGVTEISGTDHIDRGYENIEQKLRQIGAEVRREAEAGKGTALCLA